MLKKPSEVMLLGQVFVFVLLLSGFLARYVVSQQKRQVLAVHSSVSPNELLHAAEVYLTNGAISYWDLVAMATTQGKFARHSPP